MTKERFSFLENEIFKIKSSSENLTDDKTIKEINLLFKNIREKVDYFEITAEIQKPTTKQDALEEMADAEYNRLKEEK